MNHLDKTLIRFWDSQYQSLHPSTINPETATVSHEFDAFIKEIGDTSKRVLDLGSGKGYCLMMAKILGSKMIYGEGIEPSGHAVKYVNQMIHELGYSGLVVKQGTHSLLKKYPSASFDGVIVSNVLDVVPRETSEEMIDALTRVLKKNGRLLVKVNFHLDQELLKRVKMTKVDENLYALNGVIRSYNLTSDKWIERFESKGYECIRQGTYDRVKTGPKDRLFMFIKRGEIHEDNGC